MMRQPRWPPTCIELDVLHELVITYHHNSDFWATYLAVTQSATSNLAVLELQVKKIDLYLQRALSLMIVIMMSQMSVKFPAMNTSKVERGLIHLSVQMWLTGLADADWKYIMSKRDCSAIPHTMSLIGLRTPWWSALYCKDLLEVVYFTYQNRRLAWLQWSRVLFCR